MVFHYFRLNLVDSVPQIPTRNGKKMWEKKRPRTRTRSEGNDAIEEEVNRMYAGHAARGEEGGMDSRERD